MTTPPGTPPHPAGSRGADGRRAATTVVTAGRPPHAPGAPLSEPITMASTYVEGGDPSAAYGRFANPVWASFEQVLGDLEGGRALVYSSGMAAIAAVVDLAFARAATVGETPAALDLDGPAIDDPVILTPVQAYSGTLNLIPRDRYLMVPIDDTEAVVRAIDMSTRRIACVWIESPTNPGLQIADIAAIAEAAHRRGLLVVVDNTFATPISQTPLDAGADVVVHSVTKLLAGHSDVVLGAIVSRDDELLHDLLEQRTKRGSIASPFDSWLALRGMRTLAVRVQRASANATELATRLAQHPAISVVRYPGLPSDPGYARAQSTLRYPGSIVCIEFRGGVAAAERLSQRVRLWVPATSLGGVESTLERRRRWPGESSSVDESLVRLSVGIEDVEDLWADLVQAMEVAGNDS